MPLIKCSKCHHEYETMDIYEKCDWCGAEAGEVLEEKTSLEKMIEKGIDLYLIGWKRYRGIRCDDNNQLDNKKKS